MEIVTLEISQPTQTQSEIDFYHTEIARKMLFKQKSGKKPKILKTTISFPEPTSSAWVHIL